LEFQKGWEIRRVDQSPGCSAGHLAGNRAVALASLPAPGRHVQSPVRESRLRRGHYWVGRFLLQLSLMRVGPEAKRPESLFEMAPTIRANPSSQPESFTLPATLEKLKLRNSCRPARRDNAWRISFQLVPTRSERRRRGLSFPALFLKRIDDLEGQPP
jgi:hypothetical protein